MHKWSLKEQMEKKWRKEGPTHNKEKVFLDIAIDGREVGRVLILLALDVVPKTADNFRMLCTGELGRSARDVVLNYTGSAFHRIEKGFVVQGGDIVSGNGKSGECAARFDANGKAALGCFDDENFTLKHSVPGCVSMANRGPNTNNSQFFITLAPAPHLDGTNVCFGRVIKGMEVVHAIARVEVDADSADGCTPKQEVRIVACGELPFDEDTDSEAEAEKVLKKEIYNREQTAKQARAAVTAAMSGSKRERDEDDVGSVTPPAQRSPKRQRKSRKSALQDLELEASSESE